MYEMFMQTAGQAYSSQQNATASAAGSKAQMLSSVIGSITSGAAQEAAAKAQLEGIKDTNKTQRDIAFDTNKTNERINASTNRSAENIASTNASATVSVAQIAANTALEATRSNEKVSLRNIEASITKTKEEETTKRFDYSAKAETAKFIAQKQSEVALDANNKSFLNRQAELKNEGNAVKMNFANDMFKNLKGAFLENKEFNLKAKLALKSAA